MTALTVVAVASASYTVLLPVPYAVSSVALTASSATTTLVSNLTDSLSLSLFDLMISWPLTSVFWISFSYSSGSARDRSWKNRTSCQVYSSTLFLKSSAIAFWISDLLVKKSLDVYFVEVSLIISRITLVKIAFSCVP